MNALSGVRSFALPGLLFIALLGLALWGFSGQDDSDAGSRTEAAERPGNETGSTAYAPAPATANPPVSDEDAQMPSDAAALGERLATSGLPAAVLQAPDGDPVPAEWFLQPIAPNIESWEALAENDPEAARFLAISLHRCVRADESIERIVADWNEEAPAIRAAAALPADQRGTAANLIQRYRYRVQAIEHCHGVENAAAKYLRWLEFAARGVEDPERRDRLRLEWIERMFLDMRTAASRIGRIDEVLRRRDQARVWLEELRDAGNVRAIDMYVAARMRASEWYAQDRVEGAAWYFVWRVRTASAERGASIWRAGVEPSAQDSLNATQAAEATERGRAVYLRVFGKAPG